MDLKPDDIKIVTPEQKLWDDAIYSTELEIKTLKNNIRINEACLEKFKEERAKLN